MGCNNFKWVMSKGLQVCDGWTPHIARITMESLMNHRYSWIRGHQCHCAVRKLRRAMMKGQPPAELESMYSKYSQWKIKVKQGEIRSSTSFTASLSSSTCVTASWEETEKGISN